MSLNHFVWIQKLETGLHSQCYPQSREERVSPSGWAQIASSDHLQRGWLLAAPGAAWAADATRPAFQQQTQGKRKLLPESTGDDLLCTNQCFCVCVFFPMCTEKQPHFYRLIYHQPVNLTLKQRDDRNTGSYIFYLLSLSLGFGLCWCFFCCCCCFVIDEQTCTRL